MNKLRAISITLFFILSSFLVGSAWAHDGRPMVVQVKEVQPNQFLFTWTVPKRIPLENYPQLYFPKSSELIYKKEIKNTYSEKELRKFDQGLVGQKIFVEYPYRNVTTATLFRVQYLNGEELVDLLEPLAGAWIVPDRETKSKVAKEYTALGIDHILEGIDHLLFLVCLLFLARTGKRILIAVTGFTLAHSVTLILASLKWIELPIIPVEAVIALSILFLATEIARNRPDTITSRYPIVVSISFGLLHGFGFAAVLAEIGLPQVQLLTGLICFNVGVEIGQVFFIVVFIGVLLVFRKITHFMHLTAMGNKVLALIKMPLVYMVGILSSYWMFERIALF